MVRVVTSRIRIACAVSILLLAQAGPALAQLVRTQATAQGRDSQGWLRRMRTEDYSRDLEALSAGLGDRRASSNLERAREYIVQRLKESGLEPVRETFLHI